MRRKVGFLINPKSGYGISLNRPGSDLVGDYDPENSHSCRIASGFMRKFGNPDVEFLTASGHMGEMILLEAGMPHVRVVLRAGEPTSREDTLEFIRRLNGLEPDLLLFFGGDGTAADISSVISDDIPVIGIPSGVKMHSSVFAATPDHGRKIFSEWLSDAIEYETADVVDADEQAMVNGRNVFSVKGKLKVPVSPHMMLSSKREYESTDIMGAVEYIIERMEDGISYFIGSGSTCKAIVSELGFRTPFYGVDVIRDGKLIAENAGRGFLSSHASENRVKVILTPIGGQGFVVGRGNRQIDDTVLRSIDPDDITVIASAVKLTDMRSIVIDSEVWKPKWLKVIYDYGRFRMMRVET